MINLIWAEAANGVIGQNGRMPWHSHEDMVHFRQLTTGHPVLMGWKTFKSLGSKPLPKRDNLVLTHRTSLPAGVTPVSLEDVQRLTTQLGKDLFVIGGASVYRQLLPFATSLFRTVIEGTYPGETKMPPINYDQWRLVDSKTEVARSSDEPNCTFQLWQRSNKEQH
ncbi:dihydrofolate reductase [uncultured Limosilactobacillus sp.]|uniref:dihydrofolate reductase n=1 Tax=uncultured Limosilactobacillus sp. TaxID=2837629 RepID=UPI0025E2FC16|nr:dihydrofolate reductase [uncultured Limosilactobacillus sp.]